MTEVIEMVSSISSRWFRGFPGICIILLMAGIQVVHAAKFTDGFESGDFSKKQDGIQQIWASNGGAGELDGTVIVSTANPKDGNYSVEFVFKAGGRGGGASLLYTLGDYQKDIWVQADIYWPENFDFLRNEADAHNKLMKAFADDDTEGYLGLFEQHHDGANNNGEVSYHWAGSYFYFDSPKFHIPDLNTDLGKWTNYIYRIKFADTSSSRNGIFQIWKNGVLKMDVQNVNNYTAGKPGVNRMFLMGPNDAGHAEETRVYIDNVVISTEPLTPGFNPPNPPIPQ